MTAAMTRAAIDGMRKLTLQIDPSIESLLEAHGFAFCGMNAAADGAVASFRCQNSDELTPWLLSLSHSATGEMMVCLSRGSGEQQQVSLSLRVGTESAATLAEAAGLAVSFVVLNQQMKAVP